MNDDKLSKREHDDMRHTLLAGAQRIKPVGAHRMQLIAASVAIVLVAGVTGGAIATASILGSAPVQPAVTPTPSPSASAAQTPTPTPPAEETAVPGTLPFGGECENAMTDSEAAAITGAAMFLADYRWRTGAEDVLGGIDCLWQPTESYAFPQARVYAYPVEVVPAAIRDEQGTGCVDGTCVGVFDGIWLYVMSSEPGPAGGSLSSVFATVAARLGDHQKPAPTEPTSAWWSATDCAVLASLVDAAALGFDRASASEVNPSTTPSYEPWDIPIQAGAATSCSIELHRASGDGAQPDVAGLRIYPGAAVAFSTVLAAENARAVPVKGATSAVIVPSNDRYEGYPNQLLVSDGVNVLELHGWGGDNSDLEVIDMSNAVRFAEAILPLL